MKNWKDNKRTHDRVWGKIYAHAETQISAGLDVLQAWTNTNLYEMQTSALGRDMRNIPYTLSGQLYFAAAEEYLQIKLGVLTEAVMNHLSSDTDLIVDLGSGWGRNSIYLSHLFGDTYDFLACELSDSGRQCTNRFVDAYGLPITTLPFNYYDNTTVVERLREKEYQKVVFFSSYSIEQITTIGSTFFTSLLELPIPQMDFVHLEPVSWQLLDTPKNTSDHYNEDLVSVIREVEESGLAKVHRMEPNHYGHRQEFAASLITWSKNSA